MNYRVTLYILSLILVAVNAAQADVQKDTHYNDIGFFDIHVCNLPDRQLFFMPLFQPLATMTLRRLKSLVLMTGRWRNWISAVTG